MPLLGWIAFWSLLMGVTASWGELPRPIRVPVSTNSAKRRRDHPAV